MKSSMILILEQVSQISKSMLLWKAINFGWKVGGVKGGKCAGESMSMRVWSCVVACGVRPCAGVDGAVRYAA